MTVEESIELAYAVAYAQGHRDGSDGTVADGDEHWQRFKRIHMGTDALSWSFAEHLRRAK